MRYTLRWAGLLSALLLVVPTWGADAKKLPDNKQAAADKLVSAGEFVGRIVNVEGSKKSLTVELTLKYGVPNEGAYNAYLNAQANYQQALLKRDIQGARNAQVEMLKQQANLVTVKEEKQNLDIETADDVKIRLKDPPVALDDKGFPKKYTAKELKELKGDAKLPGYPSDFDSLHNDQIVQVKLMKKKDPPKIKGGKDVDKDALTENKPSATMIYVLGEPPSK